MNVVSELNVGLYESEVVKTMANGSNTVHKRLRTLIHENLEMIRAASSPQSACRWVSSKYTDRKIILDGKSLLESAVLTRVMQHSSKAVVFVVTLGTEVDRLVQEAMTMGMQYGFVMDFVASKMAEQAAESFQHNLIQTLAPNQGMTLRYSPGYCDWPLGQQEIIFKIVDGEQIGVSINEHFLMQPEKTISGIIGIGPKDLIEKTKNACRSCMKKGCNHRRAI